MNKYKKIKRNLKESNQPEGEGWRPVVMDNADEIDTTKYELSQDKNWYRPLVVESNIRHKKIITEQNPCANLGSGWRPVTVPVNQIDQTKFELSADNKCYRPKSQNTGGGGGTSGGGGNTGITDQIFQWGNNGWGVVNSLIDFVRSGVREFAGVANNAIDETADLLRRAGHKAYKAGGRLYTDFTGSLSDLKNQLNQQPQQSWISKFPCLKDTKLSNNGKYVIVTYGNENYYLFENGAAVIEGTNFVGTWKCETPSNLLIDLSGTEKLSNNQGGVGNTQSCDPENFPNCILDRPFISQGCYRSGIAIGDGKEEYSVHYYLNKGKDKYQNDAFLCEIIASDGQRMNGYYYCASGNQVVITSNEINGYLKGTDKKPNIVLSERDYEDLVNTYEDLDVEVFFRKNNAGKLLGLDLTTINQTMRDLKNYINTGYRGFKIGRILEFLIDVKKYVESSSPQNSKQIGDFLESISAHTANAKQTFDPDYDVTTNPTDINLYVQKNIEVKPFKGELELYRYKDYETYVDNQSLSGTSKDQLKLCQTTLENYINSMGVGGRFFGERKLGTTMSNQEKEKAKQIIRSCNRSDMYQKGFLGKNKRYVDAINYLAKLGPDNSYRID